ncbi:DUF3622 domain-containing protein [Oceanicoccus sagamiensis]|uniref:DUF3622 domain-containing protein n=1 Tax=Oceanicoccus sagamiensis TaxID=716816 RepID=A0A1X9NHP9_9GAMM|nr:DUF3622 domain-containing protein [Oceanicoccus sagamiensis]ARN75039.1 hypothetical protein BST96_13495 [Oceanicoccus sagamiensis]
MSKTKKFSTQVLEDNGSWKAEIHRKVTAKTTTVSKAQDGFSTEQEAQDWAEAELQLFMKQLNERNKQRNQQRA